MNPEIYFWPDVGDVHVYNNLIVVSQYGETIPTLLQNDLNELYISHNLFYDVSRIDLDSDLENNALYQDPLLLNSVYLGENDPQAYQIQDGSPAIGSGFLINGSNDTINYLEHNGGLDYFGNSVSHNSPSNIGAFNGNGFIDILETELENANDSITALNNQLISQILQMNTSLSNLQFELDSLNNVIELLENHLNDMLNLEDSIGNNLIQQL